MRPRAPVLILAALAAAAAMAVRAGGAHEHGAARLDVALEGRQLTLALDAPLDGLLGFEHRPRTAAQKAAVANLETRLRQSESLFVPTPAAGCRAVDVKLESPVLVPGNGGGKGADSGGHADLEAEFSFECVRPEALKSLEAGIFKHFPRLRRIDVQRIGPDGQGAGRLTPRQPIMAW